MTMYTKAMRGKEILVTRWQSCIMTFSPPLFDAFNGEAILVYNSKRHVVENWH